jgi:type IX secretion system PorP/SprF family membrane protein
MNIKFKHIKILLLLALILFAYQKSIAQTEPMYSQYMFNMLGVNPAYAGNREATSFNLFQRKQWIGLQGAPQTTSFSFDQSMLNKRAGWGIQFYDDKIGVEKADGINIMGSTRIQVSENGILSGGLSLGLMNYRIDLMNVTERYTPNDPAFY